jgi:hypothetical protein
MCVYTPNYRYQDARRELYLMVFDGLIDDDTFCFQVDLLTALIGDK